MVCQQPQPITFNMNTYKCRKHESKPKVNNEYIIRAKQVSVVMFNGLFWYTGGE